MNIISKLNQSEAIYIVYHSKSTTNIFWCKFDNWNILYFDNKTRGPKRCLKESFGAILEVKKLLSLCLHQAGKLVYLKLVKVLDNKTLTYVKFDIWMFLGGSK